LFKEKKRREERFGQKSRRTGSRSARESWPWNREVERGGRERTIRINPPDQIRRLALELAKGEIERKPGEAGARREGASPRKKKGKGKGKGKEKFRNREAATRDRAEA
jgi:hypothetical protein